MNFLKKILSSFSNSENQDTHSTENFLPIPSHYRYPQKGDIYESLRDQKVDYLVFWSAPYTDGGEGMLNKGEIIHIEDDPEVEKPRGSYATPENYETLEERLIPDNIRSDKKYRGYYLFIDTIALNETFKLVEKRQ